MSTIRVNLAALSGLSSIVQFTNGVKMSGNLPSTAPQSIGSKLESHALPMPEIIASLRINLSGGFVQWHIKPPIVALMRIDGLMAHLF